MNFVTVVPQSILLSPFIWVYVVFLTVVVTAKYLNVTPTVAAVWSEEWPNVVNMFGSVRDRVRATGDGAFMALSGPDSCDVCGSVSAGCSPLTGTMTMTVSGNFVRVIPPPLFSSHDLLLAMTSIVFLALLSHTIGPSQLVFFLPASGISLVLGIIFASQIPLSVFFQAFLAVFFPITFCVLAIADTDVLPKDLPSPLFGHCTIITQRHGDGNA